MIKKRTRLTPQPAARKSVGKKTPKGRSDKKLGAKNSQNIVHPGLASETDREKQRLSDSLKLQYYFGGHWIAYRHTNQGKEVLAVGMDEIGQLMRKRMSAVERDAIVLGYCDPW